MIQFVEAAEYYLALGWRVYPVAIIGGRKHPLSERGVHDASNDRVQIATWSKRWPRAQIAVATGAASGVFVIDVDGPKGEATFECLTRVLRLPDGPIALSGRGRHLYFLTVGPVQNRVGSVLGPGIDVRGDGGGVWAPPSIHESGKVYEWLQDPVGCPPRLPPLDLIRILTGDVIFEPGKPLRRRPTITQRALVAMRNKPPSVDGALRKLATAREGTRNRALYSAAFVCGRAVAAGTAAESECVAHLRETARAIGLDRAEIDPTIKSGMGAGLKA